MEEILKGLIGKKIDVACGQATAFRGRAEAVGAGVLTMKAEHDVMIYIAIEKISAVAEAVDAAGRPGFIA